MRADELAEDLPTVALDSPARDAAVLLAERRLPGLVVLDADGRPHSILPASQVVAFIVPSYVRDDPSLAGVLGELAADKIADRLAGETVASLLPEEPTELPRVNADDTIVEVAAVMARLHCPLVAVMDDDDFVGTVSASRLLRRALPER